MGKGSVRVCALGVSVLPAIMEFDLPLVSPRLMSIVVLHGFLDVAHPTTLLAYVPAVLPNRPASSWRDSFAFGCASLIHFGYDVHMWESLALHACVLLAYRLLSDEGTVAVIIVLAHFFLVHIPRLWVRAFEEPRPLEALLLVSGLLVSLFLPESICRAFLDADMDRGRFRLSLGLQRLIACHVLASLIRYR